MLFYTFMPGLLNMSLTASVVILCVLLLRLLLKKAPKVISYALWGIVLFRLLCPVSFVSDYSVFGLFDAPVKENGTLTSRIEYVPDNIVHTEYPAVVLPVPGVDAAINHALPQGEEQLAADPLEAPMAIAVYVWMAGVLVMSAYAVTAYVRLKRRLVTASPLRGNIYLADEIVSPMVLGLFRPKIYLPSALEEREQAYIICHEKYHIRRLDHVAKVLAFGALCIHWFNPFVWVAFIMAGRDMEMSCDEAVVKKMGTEVLADYTASLLSLATGKRIVAGMPLAFGEGDTKGRIRNLAAWKKPAFLAVLAAVLVCLVFAVCLLTNPGRDSFSIKIVIPAGSQDAVIYAEEEISPTRNYVVISCGEGLSDTLVSLKPVEVKTETAYDEAAYLTPGMPVRMKAEKGGWFKIGVSVQNDTDEDKLVYVKVKHVEVRIADEAAPAEAVLEAEILELHDSYLMVRPKNGAAVNSADRIVVPIQSGDMGAETQVGDMVEISYDGEIMETYPAQLGKVYSVRLLPKKTALSLVEEHRLGALLPKAISDAILAHNRSDKADGLYHCASFVMLDQEISYINSALSTSMQLTVYGLAFHQAYEYSGPAFREVQGSHIPVVITFEAKDGEYALVEYWEPRDGSDYERDIRERFPDEIEEEAMDTQKYLLAQIQNCYEQAVEHGGVDTNAVVEQLLETIVSSPSNSSDIGTYIDGHPVEYRELSYYGQYTLRYCFEQFMSGEETGLFGHIMAAACQDIMLGWGEGYTFPQDISTGQEWFEVFKSNAKALAAQYSDEDMAEAYPGAFLLLQMAEE